MEDPSYPIENERLSTPVIRLKTHSVCAYRTRAIVNLKKYKIRRAIAKGCPTMRVLSFIKRTKGCLSSSTQPPTFFLKNLAGDRVSAQHFQKTLEDFVFQQKSVACTKLNGKSNGKIMQFYSIEILFNALNLS